MISNRVQWNSIPVQYVPMLANHLCRDLIAVEDYTSMEMFDFVENNRHRSHFQRRTMMSAVEVFDWVSMVSNLGIIHSHLDHYQLRAESFYFVRYFFQYPIFRHLHSMLLYCYLSLLFDHDWESNVIHEYAEKNQNFHSKYFTDHSLFTFSSNLAWSFNAIVWSTKCVNVFERFSLGNRALSKRWYILNQNL